MTGPAHTALYAWLWRHWGVALLLMCLSFLLLGFASYNIVQTLAANLQFLMEHGWDAVEDGGLVQLLELLASGLLAGLCYLGFKLNEKILIDRLTLAESPYPAMTPTATALDEPHGEPPEPERKNQ